MSFLTAALVGRVNKHDMGKAAPALLDVWIYFNLISNTIFLPLLVVTFLFSKKAKRHPTLVNVCMTWIFSGVFSLLLYYAGVHRAEDPEPNKALCIAQTSLLYGITPMWSVAILVLVYHMIINVLGEPGKRQIGRMKMFVMLSAPYIVQCSFTLATFVAAVAHPENVTRNRRYFYCALKFDPLSNAMTIFTFLICLGITALEIQLAAMLYRNWRGIKSAGQTSKIDVQLLLRVLVFGIYVFFGMVVNVVSMFDEHSIAPDMYAATVGTVVFLVFGTQADVINTWCFWRRSKAEYLPRHSNWRRQSLDPLKTPPNMYLAEPVRPPMTPPAAAQSRWNAIGHQ